MNDELAAELRARAEKARVRRSRIAARTGRADYQEGKADALDEAASLVESADSDAPDPADSTARADECPTCGTTFRPYRYYGKGNYGDPCGDPWHVEPAPAEEARAIEAHICLDCGTIYDHPTVCGLNGADSPTVPVRDAIQSREPAPAVREEARADFLHQGHDTPEEAFDLDPEVVTEERERDEPASTRVREDDEARVHREVLQQIAAMPTVQRNPDGDDQAAATMKLLAQEALDWPASAAPPTLKGEDE